MHWRATVQVSALSKTSLPTGRSMECVGRASGRAKGPLLRVSPTHFAWNTLHPMTNTLRPNDDMRIESYTSTAPQELLWYRHPGIHSCSFRTPTHTLDLRTGIIRTTPPQLLARTDHRVMTTSCREVPGESRKATSFS
nr:hypothetical protein CFP56_02926 [Quercus suber]